MKGSGTSCSQGPRHLPVYMRLLFGSPHHFSLQLLSGSQPLLFLPMCLTPKTIASCPGDSPCHNPCAPEASEELTEAVALPIPHPPLWRAAGLVMGVAPLTTCFGGKGPRVPISVELLQRHLSSGGSKRQESSQKPGKGMFLPRETSGHVMGKLQMELTRKKT